MWSEKGWNITNIVIINTRLQPIFPRPPSLPQHSPQNNISTWDNNHKNVFNIITILLQLFVDRDVVMFILMTGKDKQISPSNRVHTRQRHTPRISPCSSWLLLSVCLYISSKEKSAKQFSFTCAFSRASILGCMTYVSHVLTHWKDLEVIMELDVAVYTTGASS